MIDRRRVQLALDAVESARADLQDARACHGEDADEAEVSRRLDRKLGRTLGDSGLNADFVNSAYLLSHPTGGRSRFGQVIPSAGMVYLFETDEFLEFSILRVSDRGHDAEDVYDLVAEGKVADGSLARELRKLLVA